MTIMHDLTLLERETFFLPGDEKIRVLPYQQQDMGSHAHQFFELAYVTGGTALHTMNGTARPVSQGDCFVIDYGSVHSYTHSRSFQLINCLFLPESVDDTLQGCRSFDQLLRHCPIRHYTPTYQQTPANRIFRDADGGILALLQQMQTEYTHKHLGYQEVLRCQLVQLMVRLTRFVVQARETRPKSEVVLEVVRYVRERYAQPITLRAFCREKHFDLQYISRRFKKETGVSFQEYLQQTRIEQSCRLLAGSGLRISEVAQAVGYRDDRFFAAVFKRLVAMPPREYRRQFSQAVP